MTPGGGRMAFQVHEEACFDALTHQQAQRRAGLPKIFRMARLLSQYGVD